MRAVLLAIACFLVAGCGRLVVVSPETAARLNSPDWNIRRAPLRGAPAAGAAQGAAAQGAAAQGAAAQGAGAQPPP